MKEIDEKIVNEILKPAGVWPISESIEKRIAKSEIDFDAFLLLKNKDLDFLGFNLGPKRKIQNQVKKLKNGFPDGYLLSEFSSEDEDDETTLMSSEEYNRLKHEAYVEKTREYKKAYMRAYRKRNRAKLNEYNRFYKANGRRGRQASNGSGGGIKQEQSQTEVSAEVTPMWPGMNPEYQFSQENEEIRNAAAAAATLQLARQALVSMLIMKNEPTDPPVGYSSGFVNNNNNISNSEGGSEVESERRLRSRLRKP